MEQHWKAMEWVGIIYNNKYITTTKVYLKNSIRMFFHIIYYIFTFIIGFIFSTE